MENQFELNPSCYRTRIQLYNAYCTSHYNYTAGGIDVLIRYAMHGCSATAIMGSRKEIYYSYTLHKKSISRPRGAYAMQRFLTTPRSEQKWLLGNIFQFSTLLIFRMIAMLRLMSTQLACMLPQE